MFQWLRLWASTAGHLLSIPSSGTKIPQAVWLGPPPENWFKTRFWGTFLAVQWLRLHLPMQEVPVQSLMQRTCDQRNKSIKQKQYYNKFNKDFFLKKKVCKTTDFEWPSAAAAPRARAPQEKSPQWGSQNSTAERKPCFLPVRSYDNPAQLKTDE